MIWSCSSLPRNLYSKTNNMFYWVFRVVFGDLLKDAADVEISSYSISFLEMDNLVNTFAKLSINGVPPKT